MNNLFVFILLLRESRDGVLKQDVYKVTQFDLLRNYALIIEKIHGCEYQKTPTQQTHTQKQAQINVNVHGQTRKTYLTRTQ